MNIKEGNKRQYIIDKNKIELNTEEYISTEIDNRISRGAEYLFINSDDNFISSIPEKYLKNMIFFNSDFKIYNIKQ